jgi:hypothetical protein
MKKFSPFAIAILLLTASSQALEPELPSKTAVYIAAARAIGSKNTNRKELDVLSDTRTVQSICVAGVAVPSTGRSPMD